MIFYVYGISVYSIYVYLTPNLSLFFVTFALELWKVAYIDVFSIELSLNATTVLHFMNK